MKVTWTHKDYKDQIIGIQSGGWIKQWRLKKKFGQIVAMVKKFWKLWWTIWHCFSHRNEFKTWRQIYLCYISNEYASFDIFIFNPAIKAIIEKFGEEFFFFLSYRKEYESFRKVHNGTRKVQWLVDKFYLSALRYIQYGTKVRS